MKTKVILFVVAATTLILALAITHSAAPADVITNVITSSNNQGHFRLEITSSDPTNLMPLASYRFQNRTYLCAVTVSNLLRSPIWYDKIDEPPLSPKAALAIALKHASHLPTDAVRFEPDEVALQNRLGIWFYVIQLEPISEVMARYGGRRSVNLIKIAVLMDGTVAERFEQ